MTNSGAPPDLSTTDAVVLVGGRGTRLRPITLSTAKPMVPVAGVPFLAHLLSRIRAAGMTHVVLGTSYRAEAFEEYFGDGVDIGLEIDYVTEDEPLGTGGAIRNVVGTLRGERAMIFNGDILSGVDLTALWRTHIESAADATLHLVRVTDPSRFGSVPTDGTGRVTAFVEKTDTPPTDQVNAGCYVFERGVIESIPPGRPVSVERETFPGLLAAGAHLHGYVESSYWLDLGTPAALVRGSADLVQGLAPSDAVSDPGRVALVLPDARVHPDAAIDGGSAIGRRARVAERGRVDGSIVYDDARIEAGALVTRSVIGAGAVIGAGTVVTDAVIGDGARVGARCELVRGLRLWPDTTIPDGALRFSPDN